MREIGTGFANVVPLPGAARRRVRQYYNPEAKAARSELRDSSPFNAIYKAPWARVADRKREEFEELGITRSPELLLSMLMFNVVATEAQRARIREILELMVESDHAIRDYARAAYLILDPAI